MRDKKKKRTKLNQYNYLLRRVGITPLFINSLLIIKLKLN